MATFTFIDKLTTNIWADKTMKEALKKSMWTRFLPQPIRPGFNNEDIKKWWGYYHYLHNDCTVYNNLRYEAKQRLGGWIGEELDRLMYKSLTEGDEEDVKKIP